MSTIGNSQKGRKRRPRSHAKPSAGATALQGLRGARMTDVANLANVSAMTVSRALRHPAVVDPETLKRIHGAIKATGYLPNRIAGSLASQRSNIVGLIVPSLRNSLFASSFTTPRSTWPWGHFEGLHYAGAEQTANGNRL